IADLDREGYLFEPKIDGIRATCRKQEDLTFYNRSCRDVTARYPEFDFADVLDAKSCVLDGEIVLYNRRESRTSRRSCNATSARGPSAGSIGRCAMPCSTS